MFFFFWWPNQRHNRSAQNKHWQKNELLEDVLQIWSICTFWRNPHTKTLLNCFWCPYSYDCDSCCCTSRFTWFSSGLAVSLRPCSEVLKLSHNKQIHISMRRLYYVSEVPANSDWNCDCAPGSDWLVASGELNKIIK